MMKVKLKKVYYCDFCKKHLLLPITKHEKHCTLNPNRECKLCGRKSPVLCQCAGYAGEPPERINTKAVLEDLMDTFDGCPICTLSAIRQLGFSKHPYDLQFDFKKEMEEWWKRINEEEAKADMDAELRESY